MDRLEDSKVLNHEEEIPSVEESKNEFMPDGQRDMDYLTSIANIYRMNEFPNEGSAPYTSGEIRNYYQIQMSRFVSENPNAKREKILLHKEFLLQCFAED